MERIKNTMNKCIATDNPLVSILLAVYNPNLAWLMEQLISLNEQTYSNIELIICDDCPSNPIDEDIFQKYIQNFNWTLVRNADNLGSNRTFERLTSMANGTYIAYCDQDDVWCKEKITQFVQALENSPAGLVCADMYIIDAKGTLVANSITKVRKRHHFSSGRGLAKQLLFTNFVTGCNMMIQTSLAQKAIPFCPYMVHDHWLALFTATDYEILCLETPLIYYRIHGNNQTSSMVEVKKKQDYGTIRLHTMQKKMQWLADYYKNNPELSHLTQHALDWVNARIAYFSGDYSASKILWKYRNYNLSSSLFELLCARLPNSLFMYFINLRKKNKL